MYHDTIEQRLREGQLQDGYLFPAYEGFCFLNVPGTVTSLFDLPTDRQLPSRVFEGVDTDVDHVVLVLLDGFGLDCWHRDIDRHEFLGTLGAAGTVTPLTSIYPSETAAALTTVNTGRSTVEHGRIGWDMYFEDLDLVLETLPFTTKDGLDPRELLDRDFDRSILFDGETVFRQLAEDAVDPHAFVPDALTEQEQDAGMMAGAAMHGYENVAEMALSVRRTLEDAGSPTYSYVYLPHIDGMSHYHGTESADYQAQLSMILGCLRRELVDQLDPSTAEETLLLLTADHGHIDTDPDARVDLLDFEIVVETLQRDGDGDPVPPVGGPRNAHLHLREGTAETVRDQLQEHLDARVFTQQDALARELFGPGDPHTEFADRCGDVIVAGGTEPISIYYEEALSPYIGQHGGVSPAEMLVPFVAVDASTLN